MRPAGVHAQAAASCSRPIASVVLRQPAGSSRLFRTPPAQQRCRARFSRASQVRSGWARQGGEWAQCHELASIHRAGYLSQWTLLNFTSLCGPRQACQSYRSQRIFVSRYNLLAHSTAHQKRNSSAWQSDILCGAQRASLVCAASQTVGKFISKTPIPAFIPRQDLMDQLLRYTT